MEAIPDANSRNYTPERLAAMKKETKSSKKKGSKKGKGKKKGTQ